MLNKTEREKGNGLKEKPQSRGALMRSRNDVVSSGRSGFFCQTVLAVCLLMFLLVLGVEQVESDSPVRVRFFGKLYLVPTGEPGRHGDLLALRISQEEEEERIVYLQVEEFLSPSKAQSEFSLLRDIREVKPYVRVINGRLLIPLLTEENLRKSIMVGGLFYRLAGRLAILTAHLEEEEPSSEPKQKK